MVTLQNSLFPFPVAELFQTPLAPGLSNNLMGTGSKCLWVKCRGPWTRTSCGECLKNSDPSTKSMSSVIKLPVKVKVRSKKQRFISVCDGVRVRWVVCKVFNSGIPNQISSDQSKYSRSWGRKKLPSILYFTNIFVWH